jgi:8-oxo-dGTP pyrophosphatase MutT (NUDIX family)
MGASRPFAYDPTMRFEDAVVQLERLPDPLPEPTEALRPVAVRETEPVALDAGRGIRDAAVLVLLYPGPDGEPWTVLTERAAGQLRHAGEVSFPGGAVEPEDASMAETAIREAHEEVGLDPTQCGLRLLGQLGSVEVRASGFRLHPVMAAAARRPFLEGDEREVSAVLEVPLRAFMAGAPMVTVEEERSGWMLRYGAYSVAGYRIWGATARVLGQLAALLGPADYQGSPLDSSRSAGAGGGGWANDPRPRSTGSERSDTPAGE